MFAGPSISLIIPVLNEQGVIGQLLSHICKAPMPHEVIVVDGGSADGTLDEVQDFPVRLIQSARGRARQLNAGAGIATGEVLYFLHADSIPPQDYVKDLQDAVLSGAVSGCYRLRFDSPSPGLQFFGYLSSINHFLCRGGDQSLFVRADVFRELGGYNESYEVYEDIELVRRLYRNYSFRVLRGEIITSARRYEAMGLGRLQWHFAVIQAMGVLGYPPKRLADYYARHISQGH